MEPRLTRRALLGRMAAVTAVGGGSLLASCTRSRDEAGGERSAAATSPAPAHWRAPAESDPHERTWMAWPARRDVWGGQLEGVRHDVARIARAVVAFEPVSMVARPDQARHAATACGRSVDVVAIENDDLWMRDSGPVFVVDRSGGLAGLVLNFDGWGGKQVHDNDALVAARVLEHLGVEAIRAPFVAEGGALEFDGHGTVMATESSIVNDNRNPGKTRQQLETEILAALGADRMVWVPGLRGQDITDDHIDSLARFVRPGTIAVDQPADPGFRNVWARSEKQALRILDHAVDARGRTLRHVISRESFDIPPGANPNLFVNVYVNWYVCNGAVLIPAFGDPAADASARSLVRRLYPDREVVQLRIDALGEGGGGIHCATQQQPAV